MTKEEMIELFDRHETEFLKFDRVSKKLSQRPDMHGFRMLDMLVPDTCDMVEDACHDEIFLGIDLDKLAEVIQESHIIDLHRCGVRFDESCDSLAMFV